MDCKGFIKLAYYFYNTKSVTITLKDQLGLQDKFYIEGETLRVPFWYAKLLSLRNVVEPIKELVQYEKRFSHALADQRMNKQQLITVDQDFYFEFFDYLKHILKKEIQRKEKSKKLKEFKNQRTSIIMNLIRMEKPDQKQVNNMTFEEIVFYNNAIRAKEDPYEVFNRAVRGGENVNE